MSPRWFMRSRMKRNPIVIIPLVILGLAAFTGLLYLFTLAFMGLWNYLLPELFGMKTIVFWQAAGIIVFLGFLGGAFSMFSHGKRHGHGRWPYRGFRRWRNWSGSDDEWAGDEWNIKGGWKNWKYFDEWWKAEGRTNFESYVDKVQKPEEDQPK